MCHKWRSSARNYDVNVVSDATLYAVKLARNIDCVNYYPVSSSLLFSLFVFKEFNTRSVFRLHCLYNGVKVESEDYDFLAMAYSMPNFRKKKGNNFLEIVLSNQRLFQTTQNTLSTRVSREQCVLAAQGTGGSTRILVTVLVSYSKGQRSGFASRAISAYYLNRINTNVCIKCHTQH